MTPTQLFNASLEALRAEPPGWRLETSGQALPAWRQPKQNQSRAWIDDDLDYFIEIATEAGGGAAVMAAAVAAERDAWAALPAYAHASWSGEWGSGPGAVTCGWVGGRSLLDAWSVRDEPEQAIPLPPADLRPDETAFKLEHDDVHGTGSYSLARLQADGEVRIDYFDGHAYHRMTIEPLRYWTLALESFGWFGWQMLFVPAPSVLLAPAQQRYAETYAPMLARLAALVPGAERPRLREAVEAWARREGVTG